jgi:two-component system phosphate regulon sensor histidine kinase PhoR
MILWAVIPLVVALLGLSWWFHRRSRISADELAACQQINAELRQQLQSEVAKVEARQEVVFNSMAEGILLLDINGRIRLYNQAFSKLFQVNTDVRGQTILEALRSPELAAVQSSLRSRGALDSFELDLPGLNSPRIEVKASTVLGEHRHGHGAVLVFHDITRLRRLESTRREFVANVSHELRTPLSMIKGYVETLLDKGVEDTDVVQRFLQTIKKHTDRLTFLIEDLLTLSHLESGQTAMKFAPVKVRPVVQRTIDDLNALAGQRKVSLENGVPAELAARADGDRIQQVLFNLVENAIKYGKAGGHVKIRACPVSDSKVQVAVADDGPGIPVEARDRVFERFYRIDRARSRETGGTGLGLAIVKHIIQAHGGTVWVESELERGATFFFTLPSAHAESEMRQKSAAETAKS